VERFEKVPFSASLLINFVIIVFGVTNCDTCPQKTGMNTTMLKPISSTIIISNEQINDQSHDWKEKQSYKNNEGKLRTLASSSAITECPYTNGNVNNKERNGY
jgi:hypothetical protein